MMSFLGHLGSQIRVAQGRDLTRIVTEFGFFESFSFPNNPILKMIGPKDRSNTPRSCHLFLFARCVGTPALKPSKGGGFELAPFGGVFPGDTTQMTLLGIGCSQIGGTERKLPLHWPKRRFWPWLFRQTKRNTVLCHFGRRGVRFLNKPRLYSRCPLDKTSSGDISNSMRCSF